MVVDMIGLVIGGTSATVGALGLLIKILGILRNYDRTLTELKTQGAEDRRACAEDRADSLRIKREVLARLSSLEGRVSAVQSAVGLKSRPLPEGES